MYGAPQLFVIPNLQSLVPITGQQIYDPGEPFTPPVVGFSPLYTPNWVPVLHVLGSDPGTPRNRAVLPLVNRYGPLPTKNLFIAGVAQKSQG